MSEVVDTLVIKVEGEGQSAVNTLNQVAAAIERISQSSGGKKLINLTSRLNSLKQIATGFKSAGFSELNNAVTVLSKVKDIKIPKALSGRIKELGDSVRSLDGTDFTRLNAMADGLAALQRVQGATAPKVDKSTQQTPNVAQDAQTTTPKDLTGDVAANARQATTETEKLAKAQDKVKEKSKEISKQSKITGSAIKQAFNSTVIGRFAEGLRALKRIAIYRLFRTMIKEITQGFKTGIDDMYQYSKAINGEFSKTMDQLASSSLTYKNSIGAVMAPIISVVVPWLDKVLTKLVDVNNYVAMILAGLTGKSTYSKAVRVTTEYAAAADKAAKNTSKVKDKVDELKRSLAGLDEITIIGDNATSPVADSGIANSDNGANGLDYKTMFVEAPVDMAQVQKVKDILEKIKDLAWLIAAAFAAWNIAKLLSSLGLLKGLLPKLAFVAGLTLAITGIKLIWDGIKSVIDEGLNWENFWKTVLGGTFLTGGATLIGWSLGKKFGAKIGFSIGLVLTGIALSFEALTDINKNGFTWDNLMTLLLGDAAILGGATYLGKQAGSTKIGFKIGLVITGITLEIADIENTFKEADELKKKYGNYALFTEEGLSEFIGADLKNLGMGILSGAAIGTAILPGWGTLIGAIIGGVANTVMTIIAYWDQLTTYLKFCFDGMIKYATAIWSIFTSWIDTNVIQPITNFFKDLYVKITAFSVNAWINIQKTWNSVTSWFDENVAQPISGFFEGLWNGISAGFHDIAVIIEAVWITVTEWFDTNVIKPISNFFVGLWEGIKNVWSAVATWFSNYVIQPVVNFFVSAVDNIKNFFVNLWTNIKNIWSTVATWFSNYVVQPIVNFFSPAIVNIKNFFVNLWANIKNIWNTVATWFNDKVIQPVVNFFSTAVDKIKNFFTGLWDGIKNAGVKAMNWFAQRVADVINGLIDGVNWFIDKFNSIGKWASDVTGKEFFFVKEIQHVSVPKFAEGGFPEDGLFFANHNELVGQFSNGKTAVANNEQIVEGISQGVSSANEEQNSLLKEQNRLLRMLLEKRSTIDVTTITNAMSRKNQRDGRVTVPVAT